MEITAKIANQLKSAREVRIHSEAYAGMLCPFTRATMVYRLPDGTLAIAKTRSN